MHSSFKFLCEKYAELFREITRKMAKWFRILFTTPKLLRKSILLNTVQKPLRQRHELQECGE